MNDTQTLVVIVILFWGIAIVSYKLGYSKGRLDEFNDKPE